MGGFGAVRYGLVDPGRYGSRPETLPVTDATQPKTMAWTRTGKKKDMPGGLWIKCESCGAMLFRKEFEQKQRVCGSCGYHFTLPGRERIALTADPGSFQERFTELMPAEESP